MSNKKNPGEAANVADMPNGKYEVYNNLEGLIDLTGVEYREKEEIYPILIIVRWCYNRSMKFLRIKKEDIRSFDIPLYDLENGDTFTINGGKIVKINS